MFRVSKRMEIAASHYLKLPYESKCNMIHGHNWIITVEVESQTLNENGMVVDFSVIKQLIHTKLDHGFLNDIFGKVVPTAEVIAQWCAEQVQTHLDSLLPDVWDDHPSEPASVVQVTVQESEGNIACYTV